MFIKKNKINNKLLIGILALLVIPVTIIASQHKQVLQQQAATVPCTTNITFLDGNYLKTNGSELQYMGQKVCLYGATMYTSQGGTAPNYSWNSPQFTQRIDWDLNLAQQAHLNVLRVTDYLNSSSVNPNDPIVWSNMDYLMSQARAKGIFILMDLSTYANNLKNQTINPYDQAQDAGWQQFISFVANRYKNVPNISSYSVKGEVNPPTSGTFPVATAQGYVDFYTRTTNGIFASDSNHLIEAGGLTHLNNPSDGIPWQQIFGLPHINIAAIHVYAANRLDPINGSNDLHISLPQVATWAHQNNKPVDIQEYGIVNQVGDQVRASAMQTIEQAAITNGYASIIYWNLGPETTPGLHYDVNPSYPLAWQQFVAGASEFYNTTSISPLPSTSTPSITQLPTITSVQPGNMQFSVTICPHSIGNCGDNMSSTGTGNITPVHVSLPALVSIKDANNLLIATNSVILSYDTSSQTYKGSLSIANVPQGKFLVSVKLQNYLSNSYPGIFSGNPGQTIILPSISLTAGDINNDNQLDILDYNSIVTCYGSNQHKSSCVTPPTTTTPGADINDDGVVNGIDYNLFLRELSVQK